MSKLDVEFDAQEDEKIEALKAQYGIKQTTELVRFLITFNYQLRTLPVVVLTQLLSAVSQQVARSSPTPNGT